MVVNWESVISGTNIIHCILFSKIIINFTILPHFSLFVVLVMLAHFHACDSFLWLIKGIALKPIMLIVLAKMIPFWRMTIIGVVVSALMFIFAFIMGHSNTFTLICSCGIYLCISYCHDNPPSYMFLENMILPEFFLQMPLYIVWTYISWILII